MQSVLELQKETVEGRPEDQPFRSTILFFYLFYFFRLEGLRGIGEAGIAKEKNDRNHDFF